VFVPPSGTTGDGILGRVTGSTAAPNGTVLHTEPATLEEAFPSGAVYGSVDTRALAEGATPSAAKALGSRALKADRDGAVSVGTAGLVNLNCNGAPIQLDVDLKVEARFVLDVRWGLGSVDRMRLVFELEISAEVAATVGGNASCSIGLPPKIYLTPIWGFVLRSRCD
jgi:hypothetical protein